MLSLLPRTAKRSAPNEVLREWGETTPSAAPCLSAIPVPTAKANIDLPVRMPNVVVMSDIDGEDVDDGGGLAMATVTVTVTVTAVIGR